MIPLICSNLLSFQATTESTTRKKGNLLKLFVATKGRKINRFKRDVSNSMQSTLIVLLFQRGQCTISWSNTTKGKRWSLRSTLSSTNWRLLNIGRWIAFNWIIHWIYLSRTSGSMKFANGRKILNAGAGVISQKFLLMIVRRRVCVILSCCKCPKIRWFAGWVSTQPWTRKYLVSRQI